MQQMSQTSFFVPTTNGFNEDQFRELILNSDICDMEDIIFNYTQPDVVSAVVYFSNWGTSSIAADAMAETGVYHYYYEDDKYIILQKMPEPKKMVLAAASPSKSCYARSVPFILMPGMHFELPCEPATACAMIGQILRVIKADLTEKEVVFDFKRNNGQASFGITTNYSYFTISIYNNGSLGSIVELDAANIFDVSKLQRPYFPDLFLNIKYFTKVESFQLDASDYEAVNLVPIPCTTDASVSKEETKRKFYERIMDVQLPRQFR